MISHLLFITEEKKTKKKNNVKKAKIILPLFEQLVPLQKKYFIKWQKVNGIMILAWKNQGSINQEVNFKENVVEHIALR